MQTTEGVQTRARATSLDRNDPLARVRDRFILPAGQIYLDGNSLGALPKAVVARVTRAVEKEWGEGLVRSWNDPWIDLWRSAAGKIARLVGARAEDVAVADSVSVNLFKLLGAALALRPERNVILIDGGEFPTDLYVTEGVCAMLGARATLRRVEGDLVAALDDAALENQVAVVLISHASYRTGALADMASITRAAHGAGALVIWDLSHTAGVVDVDLGGSDADFAVGCGYKYLSGGPGAPSFLYVAPRLQADAHSPIQGWLGHQDVFAFASTYQPAPGVDRFQCGTWPVLSLSALDEALDVFADVDMAAVRAKSRALSTLFLEQVAPLVNRHGVVIKTPTDPSQRGSQVSLGHPEGYAVIQALIEQGVVGDFRTPDVMRFGFAPLYVRFVDVWDAAAALTEVLDSRIYRAERFRARGKVT
jgi:kynureninase